jgi:uncharacterized delta-60 repeat protein
VVALSNQRYAGTIYATLTRFLPDGTVDTTFGTNGFAVLNPGGNRNAVASELAVDGQGRLVVGAYFVSATGTTTYLGAVRTSADGVPDQGFGTGGFFLHSFGPLSSTGGALGIASDNDVLVGGVYGPGGSVGPKQWALLRIDASGSFDGSFGSGGTLLIDVRQAGSGSGEVGDLVGLSNGSFLAGGWFVNRAVDTTHSGLLARFGATGAPDGTFGTAGRVDLVNFVGSRQSTGLQTSGRAVIMISSIALERYDTAGVRDATWGSSGVAQLTTAVATIHVGADNRLYAAGQALGAPTRIQLVRRNEDGTPDTGFGTRTLGLEAAGLTGSVTAEAICLTSDGRAYVGGSFTATGGQQGLFLAPFTL